MITYRSHQSMYILKFVFIPFWYCSVQKLERVVLFKPNYNHCGKQLSLCNSKVHDKGFLRNGALCLILKRISRRRIIQTEAAMVICAIDRQFRSNECIPSLALHKWRVIYQSTTFLAWKQLPATTCSILKANNSKTFRVASSLYVLPLLLCHQCCIFQLKTSFFQAA